MTHHLKIAALTAVLGLAGQATLAKGHDQGGTATPGREDVHSLTVTNAQALGGLKGQRPDTAGPAADNPGASMADRE